MDELSLGAAERPYHHGDLKVALLHEAELILERDGIQSLTLRAAARAAGVSHAAPANHFGDLTGLLSELAAVGYNRFSAALIAAGEAAGTDPRGRSKAMGRAYVTFARAHPGLFILMFRGERLDHARPALNDALDTARRALQAAAGDTAPADAVAPARMAARGVARWSLVHGFAMLLLDGRLEGVARKLPEGEDIDDLLDAVTLDNAGDGLNPLTGSLRVGVDARCLNTNFIRGMGEYVAPLVTHISAARDVEWVFYGNRPDLPFHRPEGVGKSKVTLRDVPGDRFHLWEQVALPLEASVNRVQVLHCTATTMPLWQPVPTVVTIHDTIPWDTGEFLAEGLYRDRLLPKAFRHCAKIITISEHSKSDISRLWPELADKVRVIRHGLNDRFLHAASAALAPGLKDIGIHRPYLLYFGGTAPRKRLEWTLELYHTLERSGIDLVVCGVPESAHEPYRRNVKPELRANVIFAPFLNTEDMPSLYQNTLGVLYPTLYEGFGFPALNAQAVGTPVIFSDVSSLRELLGPTSIALPPDDAGLWLEACRALIDRRRAAMAPDIASRHWAAQFDWRNSADAHWEVYCEAAARGRA